MKDQKGQKNKKFTWIKLPDTMQNKIYGGSINGGDCTVPYPYCSCNAHSYCVQVIEPK